MCMRWERAVKTQHVAARRKAVPGGSLDGPCCHSQELVGCRDESALNGTLPLSFASTGDRTPTFSLCLSTELVVRSAMVRGPGFNP